LDLFCGAGTISAYLSDSAGKVAGVELSGGAVGDARANAAANGIGNVSFIEGRAEHIAASYVNGFITNNGFARPDIIVLDPPRGGCGNALIDTVKQLYARRVVYVSCEPATLCRDAARLCSGTGAYAVAAIQPVDMFPRTASIETVVLFEPI